MKPMIPIPLPYNLKHDELNLESMPETEPMDMDSAMGWLNDHISWADEEVMERIFRSTVILKQANPDAPLGHCLHTALIWECG